MEKKSCYSVKTTTKQPEHSGSTWREWTVRDLRREAKRSLLISSEVSRVESRCGLRHRLSYPMANTFLFLFFRKKPKTCYPPKGQRVKMNLILSLTFVAGWAVVCFFLVCFFSSKKLFNLIEGRKKKKNPLWKSLYFLVGVFTKLW